MLALVVRCENVTLRLQRFGLARTLAAAMCGLWALAATASIVAPRRGSLELLESALQMVAAGLGLAGLACAIAALVVLFEALTAARHPGAVEVREDGIACGSVRRNLPHEVVRAGWYEPQRGEVLLTLGRGDLLRVGMLGRAQADAFLEGVAAGATGRALELALQRDVSAARVIAACLLLPLLVPLLAAASRFQSVPVLMTVGAAFAVAWYIVLTRFGAPERLLVGHDGIALEGDRGTRFISYARVSTVAPSVDGVVLGLDDFSHVSVRLLRPRAGRALDLALKRRNCLAAKIHAELEAFRKAGGEPLGAALLDRSGRSLAAWRASLRELCSRAGDDYRAAAIDPDHLVRILETRDAPPERRLGAAMALSASDDPALRHRVRVFIDTCAGDDLREAIEEAASGELDEARLERAVARMQRP
jgi:hypothetical protein